MADVVVRELSHTMRHVLVKDNASGFALLIEKMRLIGYPVQSTQSFYQDRLVELVNGEVDLKFRVFE